MEDVLNNVLLTEKCTVTLWRIDKEYRAQIQFSDDDAEFNGRSDTSLHCALVDALILSADYLKGMKADYEAALGAIKQLESHFYAMPK